jgi:O-antigen/teichoic acid export membrane protein
MIVVGMAPWVSELGLTSFLTREHARGERPVGELIGSIVPLAVVFALVVAGLAVPIAHLIGHGRAEVVRYIEIGLYTMPVTVFLGTFAGLAVGKESWHIFIAVRVINTFLTTGLIVVLAATASLSVGRVCLIYIAVGTLANIPFLLMLRGSRPWRFVGATARIGVTFGAKSWLATVAAVGNLQLDQVLLAALLSSRQLGWYSLASTLATVTSSFVGAAATALLPRAAVGASELVARTSRMTLLLVLCFGLSLGVASPALIPIVFTAKFDPAIPMLLVLLLAAVLYAPGTVISSALMAAGYPSASARAQLAGLAITVPMLVVLIPIDGGMGAAWATLASYFTVIAVAAVAAKRHLRLTLAEMCIPRVSDVLWLARRAKGFAVLRRVRPQQAI